MTKNGFRTLVTEDFDNSTNGALAELQYRGECPAEIYSAEQMRQRVPELINIGEYELVMSVATALMADTHFYRQDDPHGAIIPIREIEDVEDLFDDDIIESNEKELTLEDIKNWIATEGYSIDDVFNEDEIYDYVRCNSSVDDIFDEDDIIDWVKDNCYVGDLVEIGNIDWEWK